MKTKRDLMLATGAQLLEKVLGYGILAIFAHIYEVADMGAYFYALALGELVCLLVQMGTNEQLVRGVAAEPERARESLGEVVGLRLVVTALAVLGLIGFFYLWKPQSWGFSVLAVSVLLMRNLYFAYAAFFVGMRRMSLRVASLVASQACMLGAAGLGYTLGWSFISVLWCFLGINTALVFVSAGLVRGLFGPAPILFHHQRMARMVMVSFGLFATAVLALLRFKVDTLMLGVLPVTGGAAPEVQVAHYESAYKIFESSRFLVRPVILVYLPICAALYAQHKWSILSGKLFKMTGASLIGGVLMAGAVIAIAPWIIVTVYGEKYAAAVPVLRVLFLTVPLMYAGFVGQFMANAMHLEKKAIVVSLICLAANIGANAVVIPRYGALGAAWTTLGTEGLAMLGVAVLVYRRLAYRRRLEASDPDAAQALQQDHGGSAAVGGAGGAP